MLFGPEPPEPLIQLRLPVVDGGVDCPRLRRQVSLERCLECVRLVRLDGSAELVLVCGVGADELA